MASAAGKIQIASLAPIIPVGSVSLDLNLRIDSSNPSHFIRLIPLVGPFRSGIKNPASVIASRVATHVVNLRYSSLTAAQITFTLQ